ncbi:hypothetical protein [Comamonas thiooxydans]|uniref:hypothetical protein n=1 Tax=Comamonas thiooxydans TaxID=363952 RepID=UPI00209C2913|nr:hypothetical protein [Comamonas thiooxydans]MCO8251112.1 hypothetical protein [Comamonas thiooxydans]
MLDRVPVPTDNIYKFIALFSLVALIFSMWAIINIQTSTNEVVYKTLPEIEALKNFEKRTNEQNLSLALLERKLEVAKSDRKALSYALYGVFGVAFWMAAYGFGKWHKDIQPLVDAQNKAQLEILQLQIEKLRLENQKLAESLKGDEPPLVAASPPQPSVLAQVVRALLTR